MTTVVAVRKGQVACVAADTLSRYGYQLEPASRIENADKILEIDDTLLAPTGPASAQLVLRSYFSDENRTRDFRGIDAIFETTRQMQGVLKEEYFLNPKEDDEQEFESMQMRMLVANSSGIYGVYALRSIQEYKKFYAFGSGSEYALGALEALYETDMSAEALAKRAVEVAASLDAATEVPVTTRTIELD